MTFIIILTITVLIIGLFLEPKAILGLLGIVLGFLLFVYGGVYIMANVIGFLGGGRFASFLVLGLMVVVAIGILFPSKDD